MSKDRLPIKQERFLQLYAKYHLGGVPIKDAKYKAYIEVYGHKGDEKKTRLIASNMFSRLKRQAATEELLDSYGLGKDRLFYEINKRLNAKKPVVSKGEITGYVDDEGVRMAATQLLADINKVRGANTEININTDKSQTLIVEVMSDKEVSEYMEKVKELEAKVRDD